MDSGIPLFTITTTTKRWGAQKPMTLAQSSRQRFHLGHLSQYYYCDDLELKPKLKKITKPITNIKSKAHLEQTLQKNKGENNTRFQLVFF